MYFILITLFVRSWEVIAKFLNSNGVHYNFCFTKIEME